MSLQIRFVWGQIRNIPFLRRHLSSEVQKTTSKTTETLKPTVGTSETPQGVIKLTTTKKRMFVLSGIYKSMKDVPDLVTMKTMSRNMDRFRVRASILIMFLSACGALSSILLAKDVLGEIEEEKERKS